MPTVRMYDKSGNQNSPNISVSRAIDLAHINGNSFLLGSLFSPPNIFQVEFDFSSGTFTTEGAFFTFQATDTLLGIDLLKDKENGQKLLAIVDGNSGGFAALQIVIIDMETWTEDFRISYTQKQGPGGICCDSDGYIYFSAKNNLIPTNPFQLYQCQLRGDFLDILQTFGLGTTLQMLAMTHDNQSLWSIRDGVVRQDDFVPSRTLQKTWTPAGSGFTGMDTNGYDIFLVSAS